jgi:hypothetical protein
MAVMERAVRVRAQRIAAVAQQGRHAMTSQPLSHPSSGQAKWAFTTRRVRPADCTGLSGAFASAMPGDLVLGRVDRIGQHKKLQLAEGRYAELFPGDLIVACMGDRYAPDQFEATAEIAPTGVELVAGGGVLGRATHAHEQMNEPTRIEPFGLLTDGEGEVANIADYALAPRPAPEGPLVIGVFGTSMNAGKTTTAASLAHGLRRAGRRVAGVKATGTGAFGDFNAFADAGVPVSDFVDAGMATTYRADPARIEGAFATLLAHAAEAGADAIVVEFADGVFQQEIRAILRSGTVRDRLDGVLFASYDAAGAVGGVTRLRAHGIEPLALAGQLARSPLGAREAEAELGLRVITREGLRHPDTAAGLVGHLDAGAGRAAGRLLAVAAA